MSDETVQKKIGESGESVSNGPRELFQQGAVITGTVTRVEPECVFVDVGAKSAGIIRRYELSRYPAAAPTSIMTVGEKISVYVLELENAEGELILSKKRAEYAQAWDRAQQAKESGETLMVLITERLKGGLVADMVIRGFIPIAHVGDGNLEVNLDEYVGQTIPVKVIEADYNLRRVVLSNKMAI